MRVTSIYALIDPRTDEIRYVGKTLATIEQRLATHLFYARKGAHTACARWLKGLLDAGLRPHTRELEAVEDDWRSAERRWIADLRASGARLLNHTDGGDGLDGYSHTEAAREKIRAAHRNRAHLPNPLKGRPRPEEVKRKCSEAQKGRKLSSERRMQISASLKGRTIPEDVKRKISEALKGRSKPPRSEAHCQKIAEKAKGRIRSEEAKAKTSESLKAHWATPEGRMSLAAASQARKHGRSGGKDGDR